MAIFSDRLSLSRAAIITDDAPQWFRAVFFSHCIQPWIQSEPSYDTLTAPKASGHWLVKRLAQLDRFDPGNAYLLPALTLNEVRKFAYQIPWFHFFDLVELVASGLRDLPATQLFPKGRSLALYQLSANLCFSESAVGCELNADGMLQPKITEERELAESQLSLLEIKEPARVHLAKARLMLNQRPCDAASIIKESISALESAGVSAYPNSKTLGDVVKELRKQPSVPSLLVSIIEKLYGFGSSEPGVRHGGAENERVTRAEADYVFTTSLATISYLKSIGAI